jgi:hypothetical protein
MWLMEVVRFFFSLAIRHQPELLLFFSRAVAMPAAIPALTQSLQQTDTLAAVLRVPPSQSLPIP